MGYNISDLGGETTGAFDDWAATLDLSDPSATTVSGDFSVVPIFGGTPQRSNGWVYLFCAQRSHFWFADL